MLTFIVALIGLGCFWSLRQRLDLGQQKDADRQLIRNRVEYVIHCERLRRIGYHLLTLGGQ